MFMVSLLGSFGINATEPIQTTMNCLSCVVVVKRCHPVSVCELWTVVLNKEHRNFTFLHICTHMPLENAHEILGQYDLYFFNGSYFSFHSNCLSCLYGWSQSLHISHRCALILGLNYMHK